MSELFPTPPPVPFTWAPTYDPAGSMGFAPGGMGGALAPMLTKFLMDTAGPTNFLPHQNPAQAAMDQLVMRQYFSSTQANVFAASRQGNSPFAGVLAGGMSAITQQPITDLNRQQAHQVASFINHPQSIIKPILGALLGPENLEAVMFGQRGDPSALAGAANRIGYYRQDPATGNRRISTQSLQDFSQGLYSTLYEPTGNMENLAAQARDSSDAATQATAITKLKRAAKAEHETLISDEDIAAKITDQLGEEQVGQIYRKYQPSGKAETKAERIKEILKFDNAIRDTGVLASDETSVGSLQRRAEQAAVQSMHGFMAGQAGQVAEHLFQRGMLPQSIGALSAAERVKVLSEETLDDDTHTRLSKELARRDLLENKKDKEFTDAVLSNNVAKQEEILSKPEILDDYKGRITRSLDQIKKRQADTAAGPVSAAEAEKLLSADGMGSVAANVDAKRSGQVIKKHTEALAAVREIFGDNGNPNAPVPALMAALDALSHGASSRMNSGKVSSTLREMRTVAKEMGMGFDQMLGMSTAIGAYGDQLGLYAETKMSAQSNAMAMISGMNRAGAFTNQGFGALSKEEATQRAAVLATRAEGSVVAKGTAALRRAYAENKEQFKDTDLEIIAQKMNDPNWDGSYQSKDGQRRNFFNDAGTSGMREFSRIAENSNMTNSQLSALMRDSMTQEYALPGAALKASSADVVRRISAKTTVGRIFEASQKDPGSALSSDTEQAIKSRRALATRFTEMIIDSAHMEGGEQLDHLSKTIKDEFVKTLVAEGKLSPPEAEKEAAGLVQNLLGTSPEEQKARIQEIVSRQNRAIELQTGGEVRGNRALQQLRHGTKNLAAEQTRMAQDAATAARLSEFYAGTPFMRGADYLARINRTGEAYDFGEFLKATFNIRSHDELRNIVGPELAVAFGANQRIREDATVNRNYLNKLNDDELKAVATRDMNEEQKAAYAKQFAVKVDDEELSKRRTGKLQALKEEELKALYNRHGTGVATTKEDMIAELSGPRGKLGVGTNVAGYTETDLLNREKGEYTTNTLIDNTLQTAGGTARGATPEERARNKQIQQITSTIDKGLGYASEAEWRSGLSTSLHLDAMLGGYTDRLKDADTLTELGLDQSDAGKEKFNTYLKGLSLTPDQEEKVRQRFADFAKAKDIKLAQRGIQVSADEAAGRPSRLPDPKAAAPEKSPSSAPDGTAASSSPADPKASDKPAQAAVDGLTTQLGKLSEAVANLLQPFNKLIEALGQTPAPAATTPPSPASELPPGADAVGSPGKPATPVDPKPASPTEAAPEPTQTDDTAAKTNAGDPAAEVSKLKEVIASLQQPFNALIDAFSDYGSETRAQAPDKAAKNASSSATDPEKAIARSEQRAQSQAVRQEQRVVQVQRGSSTNASGGESSTIKGTLTLVNLQSAVLSARGGPIFTPADGGASIMPGVPATGPYLHDSAVSPGSP